MKRILISVLAAVTLLAFGASSGPGAGDVHASSPGTTVAPLLSCPDVGGDGTVDLFNDIFGVAFKFGTDADAVGPGEPDGYHVLYDVGVADGTIDLLNDIFGVAFSFSEACPLVDVQVAKATLWGINNVPATENEAALEAMGYYQASFDVPGQGVHYVNLENWDGVFDPEAPEGLVYNNGKFVAQLYVTDGTAVGWGTHAATSYPPPAVPHNVDLEGDADGPQCSPACSWAGTYDGWHMHYYLCTTNIGTSAASALPGFSTQGSCLIYGGGDPLCTIPITATPCYRWAQNVGWMGHLWNQQLNPNQIPDEGGNNGRFADCIPDGSTWKAFNCPA